MEVELFFHGVPNGHDFFGLEEEQQYFSTFYTLNNENEVQFIVETRKYKNKNYCYYSYLKSTNVLDSNDRPGSYFGLSLRFDSIYKDAIIIYQLLDIFYNKSVIGNLLRVDGANTKFLVKDFAARGTNIEKITKFFYSILQLTLSENNFMKIDDSFMTKGTGIQNYNTADCTKERTCAALKKTSKVVFSSSFLTCREISNKKESEEKFNELKISTDNAYQKITTELTEKTSRIRILNQSIEKYKGEIKEKDDKLKDNKVKQDASELINQIKEPLFKLASCISKLIPYTDGVNKVTYSSAKKNTQNKWIKFFPLLNSFLLIVMIVLILFMKTATIGVEQEIRLKNGKESLVEQNLLNENQNVSKPGDAINKTNNATIDIILKENNNYKVKIGNCKGTGEWKLDGFDLVGGRTDSIITVIPKVKGTVTMSYYQQDKVIVKRSFIVEGR